MTTIRRPSAPPPTWMVFSALVFTTLAWGASWVSIRQAVAFYDPGSLALGRYLVASLTLLPIWIVRGARLPTLRDLPTCLVLGALGFTFYNVLINTAERTITAGTASFLASIIPVLNTIGAAAFFGERVPRNRWAAIALSFTGVAIISLGAEGGVRLSSGVLFMIAAAVCAAGYGLLTKRAIARHDSLDLVTWAIWAGTLLLVPFGLNLGTAVTTAPTTATANVVFLGVVPGAFAYAALNYAIAQLPMARAISFLYLVAPLAVVFAWLFLDEVPPAAALVGGLVALTGVIWTQLPAPKSPR